MRGRSARTAAACLRGLMLFTASGRGYARPGGSPRPCAAHHLDSAVRFGRRPPRLALRARPGERAVRAAAAARHAARRVQRATWHALDARFSVFIRVCRSAPVLPATQCRPLRLLLSVLAGVVGMHIYLYSLESRPLCRQAERRPTQMRQRDGQGRASYVCVCVLARRPLRWLEADEGRLRPRRLSQKPELIWPVFW